MRPTVDVHTAMGGEAGFRRLVAAFYERVAADPVLRPLYPDEDLAPAAERLALFLSQYWGGTPTYSQRRGHPRLRMRHAPFPIGERERDAWLAAMRAALDEQDLDPAADATLWGYLARAADLLRNHPG